MSTEESKLEESIPELVVLLDQVRPLLEQGDYSRIQDFVSASFALADLEIRRDNPNIARRLMAEARRWAHEATFLDGELSATFNLAKLCLFQRDFRLAHDYILLVVESFKKAFGDSGNDHPTDAKQALYDVLIDIAHAYYYELEDFKEAASLGEEAIHLLPQREDGYYYLGLAQLRLEQYEAATLTWKSAIALSPTRPFYYSNYGSALNQIGRHEEALAALNEAIRLSPDNLRYHYFRGQLNQLLNRHEDAISDFTYTIHLCEQFPEREGASSSVRTEIEYSRNMPNRDISDFARMSRIRSYQAQGKIEEALVDIDYLIQQGDDAAKYGGYGAKGDLNVKLGRYSDAIDAYTAAIQLFPDNASSHLSRADAYIALDQIDQAIQDLIFVADRQHQPEDAIERLSQLLTRHPDHPQLLKWRGYAYQEAWIPYKAVEDLTRALTFLPDDADIYLWRGLSLITLSTSPEADAEAWNNSFTYQRILDAIVDFGSAIHLAPENAEAINAFKWLVDRATASEVIFTQLMQFGNRENGLLKLIPSMEATTTKYVHAISLDQSRHWADAIKEFTAVQSELLDTGFPVWATRLHLNIADNYLRLYELQLALDHLAEANKLYEVQMQPLTTSLESMADDTRQKLLLQSGGMIATPEVDYLQVYGIGFEAINLLIRGLKAQAYHRIGDAKRALSELGNREDFLEGTTEQARGASFQMLVSIGIILRDAGKYDDALEWLKRIEGICEDSIDEQTLMNTFGSLYLFKGEYRTALSYFKRLRNILLKEKSDLLPNVELNIAQCYFQDNKPQKAQQILRKVERESLQKFRSEHEVYTYYVLLAEVLWELRKSAEAQKAVLQALSIAEEVRGNLKLFDTRISWQANQESVYRIGIITALENKDVRTAFELVERAKSRAFVDQLATGHYSLPPSAQPLQEAEKYQQKKKDLLLRLTDQIRILGKTFIDHELLAELESLDERINVLEHAEDGSILLSATKITDQLIQTDEVLFRIRQEIEVASIANSIVSNDVALAPEQFQELLKVS